MIRTVFPLSALLLGMSAMLMGNGLFATLSAIRMTMENFAPAAIGVVVACHSIGFALACMTCDRIIQAVGYIRVFAGFAATLAVCCLSFAVIVDPYAWMALRALFGFSSAAVFMVGESWLASAAPSDSKGKVFSVYMVINKASFGAGQLLLMLGEPGGDRLFMLSAALYAICLIPVALTRIKAPEGLGSERIRLGALYRLSPVGVMGAVSAGFTNASLIGLGPVFATGLGFTVAQISYLMAGFLAGSLLLQLPIGRCSDRFDRRTVLICVSLLTAAACLGMSYGTTTGFLGMLGLFALVGGLSATVYPIAMTHANDLARPEQTVSLHAGLLLSFAMGASTGPILCSLAMQWIGPGGLFTAAAAINFVLAVFTLYRMTRRAPVPDALQGDFVAMPQTSQTTPAVGALDPRSDDPGKAEATEPQPAVS